MAVDFSRNNLVPTSPPRRAQPLLIEPSSPSNEGRNVRLESINRPFMRFPKEAFDQSVTPLYNKTISLKPFPQRDLEYFQKKGFSLEQVVSFTARELWHYLKSHRKPEELFTNPFLGGGAGRHVFEKYFPYKALKIPKEELDFSFEDVDCLCLISKNLLPKLSYEIAHFILLQSHQQCIKQKKSPQGSTPRIDQEILDYIVKNFLQIDTRDDNGIFFIFPELDVKFISYETTFPFYVFNFERFFIDMETGFAYYLDGTVEEGNKTLLDLIHGNAECEAPQNVSKLSLRLIHAMGHGNHVEVPCVKAAQLQVKKDCSEIDRFLLQHHLQSASLLGEVIDATHLLAIANAQHSKEDRENCSRVIAEKMAYLSALKKQPISPIWEILQKNPSLAVCFIQLIQGMFVAQWALGNKFLKAYSYSQKWKSLFQVGIVMLKRTYFLKLCQFTSNNILPIRPWEALTNLFIAIKFLSEHLKENEKENLIKELGFAEFSLNKNSLSKLALSLIELKFSKTSRLETLHQDQKFIQFCRVILSQFKGIISESDYRKLQGLTAQGDLSHWLAQERNSPLWKEGIQQVLKAFDGENSREKIESLHRINTIGFRNPLEIRRNTFPSLFLFWQLALDFPHADVMTLTSARHFIELVNKNRMLSSDEGEWRSRVDMHLNALNIDFASDPASLKCLTEINSDPHHEECRITSETLDFTSRLVHSLSHGHQFSGRVLNQAFQEDSSVTPKIEAFSHYLDSQYPSNSMAQEVEIINYLSLMHRIARQELRNRYFSELLNKRISYLKENRMSFYFWEYALKHPELIQDLIQVIQLGMIYEWIVNGEFHAYLPSKEGRFQASISTPFNDLLLTRFTPESIAQPALWDVLMASMTSFKKLRAMGVSKKLFEGLTLVESSFAKKSFKQMVKEILKAKNTKGSVLYTSPPENEERLALTEHMKKEMQGVFSKEELQGLELRECVEGILRELNLNTSTNLLTVLRSPTYEGLERYLTELNEIFFLKSKETLSFSFLHLTPLYQIGLNKDATFPFLVQARRYFSFVANVRALTPQVENEIVETIHQKMEERLSKNLDLEEERCLYGYIRAESLFKLFERRLFQITRNPETQSFLLAVSFVTLNPHVLKQLPQIFNSLLLIAEHLMDEYYLASLDLLKLLLENFKKPDEQEKIAKLLLTEMAECLKNPVLEPLLIRFRSFIEVFSNTAVFSKLDLSSQEKLKSNDRVALLEAFLECSCLIPQFGGAMTAFLKGDFREEAYEAETRLLERTSKTESILAHDFSLMQPMRALKLLSKILHQQLTSKEKQRLFAHFEGIFSRLSPQDRPHSLLMEWLKFFIKNKIAKALDLHEKGILKGLLKRSDCEQEVALLTSLALANDIAPTKLLIDSYIDLIGSPFSCHVFNEELHTRVLNYLMGVDFPRALKLLAHMISCCTLTHEPALIIRVLRNHPHLNADEELKDILQAIIDNLCLNRMTNGEYGEFISSLIKLGKPKIILPFLPFLCPFLDEKLNIFCHQLCGSGDVDLISYVMRLTAFSTKEYDALAEGDDVNVRNLYVNGFNSLKKFEDFVPLIKLLLERGLKGGLATRVSQCKCIMEALASVHDPDLLPLVTRNIWKKLVCYVNDEGDNIIAPTLFIPELGSEKISEQYYFLLSYLHNLLAKKENHPLLLAVLDVLMSDHSNLLGFSHKKVEFDQEGNFKKARAYMALNSSCDLIISLLEKSGVKEDLVTALGFFQHYILFLDSIKNALKFLTFVNRFNPVDLKDAKLRDDILGVFKVFIFHGEKNEIDKTSDNEFVKQLDWMITLFEKAGKVQTGLFLAFAKCYLKEEKCQFIRKKLQGIAKEEIIPLVKRVTHYTNLPPSLERAVDHEIVEETKKNLHQVAFADVPKALHLVTDLISYINQNPKIYKNSVSWVLSLVDLFYEAEKLNLYNAEIYFNHSTTLIKQLNKCEHPVATKKAFEMFKKSISFVGGKSWEKEKVVNKFIVYLKPFFVNYLKDNLNPPVIEGKAKKDLPEYLQALTFLLSFVDNNPLSFKLFIQHIKLVISCLIVLPVALKVCKENKIEEKENGGVGVQATLEEMIESKFPKIPHIGRESILNILRLLNNDFVEDRQKWMKRCHYLLSLEGLDLLQKMAGGILRVYLNAPFLQTKWQFHLYFDEISALIDELSSYSKELGKEPYAFRLPEKNPIEKELQDFCERFSNSN